MNYSTCAIGLVALSTALAACSGQATDEALGSLEQPSLCGGYDLQDVERYDGSLATTVEFVAQHQAPVGRMRWRSDLSSRYTNPGTVSGSPWCTATLISANRMITAGHCFDVDSGGWVWPRVNGTSQPITSAQGATEMLVEFNYQVDPSGAPRTVTTVGITELTEYRLGGLDYAVITLNSNAGNTFGTAVPSPFKLANGDPITIIQHPAGALKKVHAGPIASSSNTWLTYSTADTEGGSSGSGVLSNRTGYISGVHTVGGCQPDGSGANGGVPILAIYAHSPIVNTMSLDAAKLAAIL
ncbi:MAG: trypsin-like serine peptidase [Myxococcota bacterium]